MGGGFVKNCSENFTLASRKKVLSYGKWQLFFHRVPWDTVCMTLRRKFHTCGSQKIVSEKIFQTLFWNFFYPNFTNEKIVFMTYGKWQLFVMEFRASAWLCGRNSVAETKSCSFLKLLMCHDVLQTSVRVAVMIFFVTTEFRKLFNGFLLIRKNCLLKGNKHETRCIWFQFTWPETSLAIMMSSSPSDQLNNWLPYKIAYS